LVDFSAERVIMNLLNEFSGVVHAVESTHIGVSPMISGKRYFITKCHWSDRWDLPGTEFANYQLGKETELPVTCKNCLGIRVSKLKKAKHKICCECSRAGNGIEYSDWWYCNNPENFREFDVVREGTKPPHWCKK
jgi:hypothetical protein